MRSRTPDGPPDGRLAAGPRPKTRVEELLEKIREKQREIRLLELELDRTDLNELAQESDPTIPR